MGDATNIQNLLAALGKYYALRADDPVRSRDLLGDTSCSATTDYDSFPDTPDNL